MIIDSSWLCTKALVGLLAAASLAWRTVICANGVKGLAAITFIVWNAVWPKLITRIAERELDFFSTKMEH